ncbi:MAG TPA: DUF427 domain-containing protein [Mycobacteriales bacterium]|nr:DUF427 domain-containing protein [Mycobacteriales bacterium]
MTITASWKGVTIAESEDTVLVEGNHYFPPHHVHQNYLELSSTVTHCTWKGDAAYSHVAVDGDRLVDAAWYYPAPYEAAADVAGYIAFWNGVEICGMNPGEQEISPPPRAAAGHH